MEQWRGQSNVRAVHLIIHGAMAQQDGRRSVGQGGGGGSEGELPGGQQVGGEHQCAS